jgi:hypothetical protein
MRLLAAAFAIAALSLATPSFAQAGWGMSEPAGGHIGELSMLSPAHRYWDACRGEDPEAAVHGCGRMIGARVSRAHTASAHYFRSVALSALGDHEAARRDLVRAYVMFTDSVRADAEDALALYGRGLTQIRLGWQAEGEADIARASEISEGAAGRFFSAGYSR